MPYKTSEASRVKEGGVTVCGGLVKNSTFFNGRNIFLFDGAGAILSVLLLGVILPAVQPWIGMPLQILYVLAAIPVVYAVYSFICYRWANHQNPIWLKVIMGGNALYCVVTLSLVGAYWSEMTRWGVLYFALESLVLLALVAFEGRIASSVSAASRPPAHPERSVS